MIKNTNEILNMESSHIVDLIHSSKYYGYRLGDIVLNYPCSREEHIRNCYLPQKKKFPNSLAIKYTEQYKGKKSMGLKIGNHENIDDNIKILMNLCDSIVINQPPQDDTLVVTIRLGDMIEENKEKRNGYELSKLGGTFWSQNGGSRHILSAQEIIHEVKKYHLNKIILLGGAHGTGNKSVQYLKSIMQIINKEGFACTWNYNHSPDYDFAFISRARYILPGPGGFSLVARAISNMRFNKQETILPVDGGINFFG